MSDVVRCGSRLSRTLFFDNSERNMQMSANQPCPRIAITLVAIMLVLAAASFAQTTISTGSIQGTVTDQSGAVVSGATVIITGKATGRVVTVTSSSSGTYTSGALTPGDYTIRVEAQGFKTVEQT